MAMSINGKLLQLANEYYISYGSLEQKKIDASVSTLISRLKIHFATNVVNIVEFGSYKRDTILPRKYDEHSDVDLMVIFNHGSLKVTPGTYRNYLIDFAEKKYSRSNVKKSTPTVVLELDHIKYDLVPGYEQTNLGYNKTIYIPQNDSSWMITDPHGFTNELTRVNTENGSNIKKVVRLLKAWNAKVGYPIESYHLEQQIARNVYWLWGDKTLENYFFAAIDGLSSVNSYSFYPNPKIILLKENAKRVKACLQADNAIGANGWLAHILPI